MSRRPQWSLLLVALLLTVGGCATPGATAARTRPEVVPAAGAHNDTSTPFNLVSLPGLIAHDFDGRSLKVEHLVENGLSSRTYHVTYRSGALRISGRLSVPRRAGRSPLVVLAHGYEAPRTYRSGAALAREEAMLSARGFVVLLPDFRGHAGSDHDSPEPVSEPLGYPEDLVNAILAVRRADLSYVDASRVAVVGRSMGGGVALSAVAARPDLVDALVLYAPVSSSAADNYERWVAGSGDLEDRVLATYGSPSGNPLFWQEASVRNYLDRVDVPVQVHHGLADAVCPAAWSRATVAALRREGQTVEYYDYPGEGHRFQAAWPKMAHRMAEFLDENL